ncbi:MAG: hypothetical protein J6T57_04240 [Alphaproteobacteria bacterium]|nr:hypothetical protein [Alphaproteobacteria bacterium]
MSRAVVEYKHFKTWFKNNFVAIPADVRGNCRLCVFWDTKYCAKMQCTYLDTDVDFIESVYWKQKNETPDKNILVEFGNWFEKVPSQKIRSVSEEIKNNAVIEKIQKTR